MKIGKGNTFCGERVSRIFDRLINNCVRGNRMAGSDLYSINFCLQLISGGY